MILAELLEPPTSATWTIVKQGGVDHVVTLLDGAEQQTRWLRGVAGRTAQEAPPLAPPGQRPWEKAAIAHLQDQYRGHGLELIAIEDTAPLDRARLGAEGRDTEIAHVADQIRAMGELGIPVLCYNWMAMSSWARTDTEVPLRGGAHSTGFSLAASEELPPLASPGEVTEEQLWDSLAYFLRAVVPVAEEAGVRLGLHPDDPPLPEVRGVPRIIRSVEAYRRVLDIVDSPANCITLCQGNFALMTDDIPSVIREFGPRDRIVFVHFRDIRGTAADFIETFHDQGQTDLVACMQAYKEVGFSGPMRPDHVPTLLGEDNDKPGYGALGRLHALGYITGLRHAVYGHPAARHTSG